MARTVLDGVTKVFTEDDGSEIVAVDGVSLDIEDGEFLVLVGPSGCGKSTTLRMIAGLESISDGEIRLDDRVINGVPAMHRNIAMVFQSYALYPHMTVSENMRFGLEESTDLSDDEIGSRVEEAASMMGIAELLDREPSELSGGQQQRVALGRAIVRDPAVFLMDEPLSNLDAKLRAEMRTELQRLQDELGTTTIYVTHDQTEAMTMGDRIAILDDGRLQQVGTPLECYHRPNNQFVAGFIGEPRMNFLEVGYDATESALVGDEFTYPLSEEIANSVTGHDDLVLGIRPEDIVIEADDANVDAAGAVGATGGAADTGDASGSTGQAAGSAGQAGGAGSAGQAGGVGSAGEASGVGVQSGAQDVSGDPHSLVATIDVVEPMGNENVVYLALGERDSITDDEGVLIATVPGMRDLRSGDVVTITVPEGAIHVFDGKSGEALHNRRLDGEQDAPGI